MLLAAHLAPMHVWKITHKLQELHPRHPLQQSHTPSWTYVAQSWLHLGPSGAQCVACPSPSSTLDSSLEPYNLQPKNPPKRHRESAPSRPPKGLGAPFCVVAVPSWLPSWHILVQLEPSWTILLAILDPFCSVLAPSWPILGPARRILKPSWLQWPPSWAHLGTS